MAHFIPIINVSDPIYCTYFRHISVILLGTVIEYTRYSNNKQIVSILSNVMYFIVDKYITKSSEVIFF